MIIQKDRCLEVIDSDLQVTRMTELEIIRNILSGNLGLCAYARAIGSENWYWLGSTNPFAYFMPILVPKKSSFNETEGVLYLCSDADKIASKSSEIRDSKELEKGGFFFPVFIGEDLDVIIPCKLFDFGNSVFGAPFMYPNEVKAGYATKLYLMVANLSDKHSAKCNLEITSKGFFSDNIHIENENRDKLKLELEPGKLLFTGIPITVHGDLKPKDYTLTVLGKTSVGKKVVSALPSLALSVGLSALLGGDLVGYSYNQGKGFTVKFNVVGK